MRGLIRMLAAVFLLGAALPSRAGELRTLEVRNELGAMSYKLYLPSSWSAAGPALPLVVALHGGYEPVDSTIVHTGWNTLADQQGFIVAYPVENADNGYKGVWNWSAVARQGRKDRAARQIALIVQAVEAQYRADPKRVLLAGISAGGGMAVALATSYPELFTAVGVEAGCALGAYRAWDFPCTLSGCAENAFSALHFSGESSAAAAWRAGGAQARRLPAAISYGDKDKLAWAVGQGQHLEMWLAYNDWADDGADNGSVPRKAAQESGGKANGADYSTTVYKDARGCPVVERMVVAGMDHRYSGVHYPDGTTGPGPDQRLRQYRFMLEQAALQAPCAK